MPSNHLILCLLLPSVFSASGSSPTSQFFTSGCQSIGASASASVLQKNIQDWFPLGLTVWISLQSKGLSTIFSSTTVQKHQFFGAQPSLRSNSHIHTWLLKKHSFDYMDLCPKANLHQKKVMVTVWWSAASLIHYSFLNPYETNTSEKYAQRISMRCTKNCNACSQHRLTERAQYFSTTMADCPSYNQHFKSWMNWAMKFCLIRHVHLTSCQLTTTSSSISTAFCRENAFTAAGGRKCFPRPHQILKYGLLCYRNKQTYFSLTKMHWL